MPKAFDRCVAGGGKVRTFSPSEGKYTHGCVPKDGGKMVVGETKTNQKTKALFGGLTGKAERSIHQRKEVLKDI